MEDKDDEREDRGDVDIHCDVDKGFDWIEKKESERWGREERIVTERSTVYNDKLR